MALPDAPERNRKHFTVDEANKMLPLVRAIAADIVRQFQVVGDLNQRLAAVSHKRRLSPDDPYSEEIAQSRAELEAEDSKLRAFHEELTRLGVELKGQDGLCDFPSLMDGREVYLCWRLGEPEVLFWHELHDGVRGRQPLTEQTASLIDGPRR